MILIRFTGSVFPGETLNISLWKEVNFLNIIRV
jgi:hypothetical protein